MATRSIKLRGADAAPKDEPATETRPAVETTPVLNVEPPKLSQRKRAEAGRYLLQVDRQTKGSYTTSEDAEAVGLAIKTGHPIVQVSIYDSVECMNKLVELPKT